MIFQPKNLQAVGFVKKTHGFEGKFRFVLYENVDLNQKEPLFRIIEGQAVPFFIEQIEGHGAELIVKIEDTDSESEAQNWKGVELFVENSEVAEEDNSFVGWQIDLGNDQIATITEIVERPIQALLKISLNEVEHLVPLVEDWIEAIKEEEQIIVMNIPDGLLDLQ
jgi:16S rRNA processing protein RimM